LRRARFRNDGGGSGISAPLARTSSETPRTSASRLAVPNDGWLWPFSYRLEDAAAAKRHYARVIDESGEDYLYPESWFVPVSVPANVEELLHDLAAK
jgi:hypothetical protein